MSGYVCVDTIRVYGLREYVFSSFFNRSILPLMTDSLYITRVEECTGFEYQCMGRRSKIPY